VRSAEYGVWCILPIVQAHYSTVVVYCDVLDDQWAGQWCLLAESLPQEQAVARSESAERAATVRSLQAPLLMQERFYCYILLTLELIC